LTGVILPIVQRDVVGRVGEDERLNIGNGEPVPDPLVIRKRELPTGGRRESSGVADAIVQNDDIRVGSRRGRQKGTKQDVR
jgi:hypothetical protein